MSKLLKTCSACKERKISREHFEISRNTGKRLNRCKECAAKAEKEKDFKKCCACEKRKHKKEFEKYRSGREKPRCKSCDMLKNPRTWKVKPKENKASARVTAYEQRIKDLKTANEVLELAKKQEQEKFKKGMKFVKSGIRSYVLTILK